ncbi:XdhC family protein [Mesorhizobium sp. M7A.F.Ca.US.006.01.1.1]|uniref:XdhC family protein n=1 Tax=Mesorhizobium sp. M7A.F.Ca.US.006.01.1.1 TaxID=2496707 RepID=UPI000FCC9777|nr:XdhC family protein [Mesorhizobium sp. M7A.F.Ca.US.006.01.1.1]RUZ77861.1 XdhC family protein [Mesorhizobium sp. M7A.F.Ca.US.006.01.1.1]
MYKSTRSWRRFDDYVVEFAHDRLLAGKRVALITLIKIEGSSPRPLGAQMAVSETGEWVGYLSGGCIERAVVAEAIAAIEDGKNRQVRYGRGSKYLDIQLPCGSAIELFFDVQIDRNKLALVVQDLNSRKVSSLTIRGDDLPSGPLVRRYEPRRRLIVAGVGPSAVQLALLGPQADFDTVLYSPDSSTREAPELEAIVAMPIDRDRAPKYQADKRTAIVFMFHDHDWDAKLIPAALETNAFYVGAMGSNKTHALRVSRLTELGIQPAQISRIRGPAGIFSGVKSAHDIAISILAEIVRADLDSTGSASLSAEGFAAVNW